MLLAVHYRVMEHLRSLESTQEARVALSCRLGQLLRFFRALQTVCSVTRYCTLKHEPIVKLCLWILGEGIRGRDRAVLGGWVGDWVAESVSAGENCRVKRQNE